MKFPNDLSIKENIDILRRAYCTRDITLIPYEVEAVPSVDQRWKLYNERHDITISVGETDVLCTPSGAEAYTSHFAVGADCSESYSSENQSYFKNHNSSVTYKETALPNNVRIKTSVQSFHNSYSLLTNFSTFTVSLYLASNVKVNKYSSSSPDRTVSIHENICILTGKVMSAKILTRSKSDYNFTTLSTFIDNLGNIVFNAQIGFNNGVNYRLNVPTPNVEFIFNPFDTFQLQCVDDYKFLQECVENTYKVLLEQEQEEGSVGALGCILRNIRAQMEATDENSV